MNRQATRREFLKTSALAGVGVWAAGPALAKSRSPNEMLGIGIIGVGGRGGSNLQAVAATEKIVALCDVDDKQLGEAAEQFRHARKYNDFRKMLQQKDIDAVVLSTPDHTHAVAGVMAMELGKHVYCEKPLAHSVYEARILAQTAARYNVVTQMGNQRHATDRLRRVVEVIRSGAIGTIRDVVTWSSKSFSGGDRPRETPPVPEHIHWNLWLGPARKRPYHPTYIPRFWRGWWDFGTGNFGDMACHILDAPYWASNLRYPVTVEAEGPPLHAQSAPPWIIVRYGFPARGDQPPVKLTWYGGAKAPPWQTIDGVKLPSQGSLIIGEEGKLLFPHARGQVRLLPEADFADFQYPEPSLPRPESHHAEWIRGCKTGKAASSNFDYAGALAETVMAGVVAYRVGQNLEWDGAAMKATNCPQADRFIRPELYNGWTL